jgi:hypothetical protein
MVDKILYVVDDSEISPKLTDSFITFRNNVMITHLQLLLQFYSTGNIINKLVDLRI